MMMVGSQSLPLIRTMTRTGRIFSTLQNHHSSATTSSALHMGGLTNKINVGVISMMIMNHEQMRGIKANPNAGKSQKGQSVKTRQKPSVTHLEEIGEPYVPELYKTQNPPSGMKESMATIWFQFRKYLSKLRCFFRIYRRLGKEFGVSGNANFQQQVTEFFHEYKKAIVSNDLRKLNKVCTTRVLSQQKKDSKHHSEEKHHIEISELEKPKVVHSYILDLPGNREIAQVVVKMKVNEKLYSKQDLPGGKHQLNLENDQDNTYYVVFEKPLDDFSKQWMIAGFIDPSSKYFEPTVKEVMYGTTMGSNE